MPANPFAMKNLPAQFLICALLLGIALAGCATPKPSTPTPRLGTGSTMVSDKDGMTLVYVPAGNFLMGGTDTDKYATSYEKPQLSVYLDAFWIDRTDVTNAMFALFVQATGYKTDAEKVGAANAFIPSEGSWSVVEGANWQHPRGLSSDINGLDNHPVVQMSWNDAHTYCLWAGRQLPTEAQWEKAARGTDGRTYPWGNGPVAGNLLNFADKNLSVSEADKTIDDGYQFTSPVGHYPDGASPYGALDMAGNVLQWVADWFSETYYASSPSRNPTGPLEPIRPLGPTGGPYRGMRGGSWYYPAWTARSAFRGAGALSEVSDDFGFRCARSP